MHTAIQINTALWPWQLFTVVADIVLFGARSGLRYQPLWNCAAGGMVCKGISSHSLPHKGANGWWPGHWDEKMWTIGSVGSTCVRLPCCSSML